MLKDPIDSLISEVLNLDVDYFELLEYSNKIDVRKYIIEKNLDYIPEKNRF